MMKTPKFWYPLQAVKGQLSNGSAPIIIASILTPLSWVWQGAAWLSRLTARPYRTRIPSVAIGNITAGGTGKTPLVASIAINATKAGMRPYLLTRGYGGSEIGPYLTRPDDDAKWVGDEAKWLSQFAPVVVSKHRGNGARWIDQNAKDCGLIIMDDGLQNVTVAPHLRIAVFNGRLGIGNGRVIPAGPLRQNLGDGLAMADGVVISGDDMSGITEILANYVHKESLMHVHRSLDKSTLSACTKPTLAFTGIGDPDGFFNMLAAAGVAVAATTIFADHHHFTNAELTALHAEAARINAQLVTTEKDFARMTQAQRGGIIAVGLITTPDQILLDMVIKNRYLDL